MPVTTRLPAIACACAGVAALLAPASARASRVGAAPLAPATARATRVGPAPALPQGAHIAGAVSAGAPMHVTVTLQPRDPTALQAFATAVSTPGSPQYRDYLTPAQFAE